jgi:hypothetical protein
MRPSPHRGGERAWPLYQPPAWPRRKAEQYARPPSESGEPGSMQGQRTARAGDRTSVASRSQYYLPKRCTRPTCTGGGPIPTPSRRSGGNARRSWKASRIWLRRNCYDGCRCGILANSSPSNCARCSVGCGPGAWDRCFQPVGARPGGDALPEEHHLERVVSRPTRPVQEPSRYDIE